MKSNLFVACRPRKTDPNSLYRVLYVDLGYRQVNLTYSVQDIAEFLHLSVSDLMQKLDKPCCYRVGEICSLLDK